MIKFKFLSAFVFVFLLTLCTAKANIVSYQKTNDGFDFTLDKEKIFTRIIGDDLIEMKYINLSETNASKQDFILFLVKDKNVTVNRHQQNLIK